MIYTHLFLIEAEIMWQYDGYITFSGFYQDEHSPETTAGFGFTLVSEVFEYLYTCIRLRTIKCGDMLSLPTTSYASLQPVTILHTLRPEP